MEENTITKNKRKEIRNHERFTFPEKASFVIIGSIDVSNCLSDECINAKIQNITSESALLLTEHRLKPGTIVKIRDIDNQTKAAIVLWSLQHNNSYKTEVLLI